MGGQVVGSVMAEKGSGRVDRWVLRPATHSTSSASDQVGRIPGLKGQILSRFESSDELRSKYLVESPGKQVESLGVRMTGRE